LGRGLDRIGGAIAQTQPKRHRAYVEMLHLGHAHGLQDFGLGVFHERFQVAGFKFQVIANMKP
jgi:hypothetical protein